MGELLKEVLVRRHERSDHELLGHVVERALLRQDLDQRLHLRQPGDGVVVLAEVADANDQVHLRGRAAEEEEASGKWQT